MSRHILHQHEANEDCPLDHLNDLSRQSFNITCSGGSMICVTFLWHCKSRSKHPSPEVVSLGLRPYAPKLSSHLE